MSEVTTLILLVSFVGILIFTFSVNIIARSWLRLFWQIILIAGMFFLLRIFFNFPEVIETKGPVHEIVAICFCYVAMLLGMIAHHTYEQARAEEDKIKFKWQTIVMGICVSPFVFAPLLTILQDIDLASGAFTKSKLWIYFVSFQNGFFWKEVFQKVKKSVTAS